MGELRIVLASASPRRRELLEQIGLGFEVRVSQVEEKVTAVEPGRVVEELSRQKAEAVLEALFRQREEAALEDLSGQRVEAMLVIGADTVVAVDGQILGKPSDEKEAAEMLRKLSGRSHEVYTGVTVLYQNKIKVFHEVTRVYFYPMSEQEILAYVLSGDCMDKAGAYGIQGLCARYIRQIEGDYNNVVGLPVGRLYQEIKEWINL